MRHYLVLRTGVEVEQQGTINPYITAYASYIDLVLGQSLSPDLPLWFRRGFTVSSAIPSSVTITSCSARRFLGN